MKIGIDNYSYHRFFGEIYPGQPAPEETWALADFVDHILSLKYLELIECLSIETCFIREAEKTIIEQLQRLGKPIFFAWGHPNGFMGVDPAEARKQVEFYLKLSKLFGADCIRIAGSSIIHFSEPHKPQIDRVKRFLEELLPLAEIHHVKFAIENHGDFFMHELQEIIDYFSTFYLGLTLDTGNCLRLEEDPMKAVNMFGKKVYIVHAKDVALMEGFTASDPQRFGCVPAGEGITNFPAVFQSLHSVGYKGRIFIEISRMHPAQEHMGEPAIIEKSLSFLHRVRDRLEKYNA